MDAFEFQVVAVGVVVMVAIVIGLYIDEIKAAWRLFKAVVRACRAVARHIELTGSAPPVDWNKAEFEHAAAIERANKLQALRMKRYG